MEDPNSYRSPSIEMLSSKKNYPKWCDKLNDCLNSEGLLCCIEEDFQTRTQGFSGLLSDSTIADLGKKIDFEALTLIQKHISIDINRQIGHASTAKEAWDMLRSLFQPPDLNQNIESASENDVKINVFDENGSYPLSGDKHFFTVFLTKSALEHHFVMNFPPGLHEMLPSVDIEAIVIFRGKDIKISYSGKEKCFLGLGWKNFTEREQLMEGDALVFELFQCEDTGFRLKVQILR